ncbi:MAG: carbon-nitrogen hydrolase family protein [Bacteroidota bacterium]
MKIAISQIQPRKGDIKKNIEIHKFWIEAAISEKADCIFFSELSLTGYEPKLSKGLAMVENDLRLIEFQNLSESNDIAIGLGVPIQSEEGVLISMMIFIPNGSPEVYSKQTLHSDELPYFIEGSEQLILNLVNKRIAPAICYESLNSVHAEHARHLGADIYLASVAKPQEGIEKAYAHYPKIAKTFSMPVLMSNCIGYCDNFLSVGQSAIWNAQGELLGKLAPDKEGLLVFDTDTGDVIKREL